MSSNGQSQGRQTRKQQFNTVPPPESGVRVKVGSLVYILVCLVVCVIFNLLYGSGWLEYVPGSGDTVVRTVSVFLPITAIIVGVIELKE
jgi:hypothetical protein